MLQHGEARMWDPDQGHAQNPRRGKLKTAADTLRDHDGIPQGKQKMLSEDSSEVHDGLSADPVGAPVGFGRAKPLSAARTACDWRAFGD